MNTTHTGSVDSDRCWWSCSIKTALGPVCSVAPAGVEYALLLQRNCADRVHKKQMINRMLCSIIDGVSHAKTRCLGGVSIGCIIVYHWLQHQASGRAERLCPPLSSLLPGMHTLWGVVLSGHKHVTSRSCGAERLRTAARRDTVKKKMVAVLENAACKAGKAGETPLVLCYVLPWPPRLGWHWARAC
jgi:hypothetical protein